MGWWSIIMLWLLYAQDKTQLPTEQDGELTPGPVQTSGEDKKSLGSARIQSLACAAHILVIIPPTLSWLPIKKDLKEIGWGCGPD